MTSRAATAAKAIRAELKNTFPGVKFSVTSKHFSMGNSVDVSWTDGPLHKDVDAVISKYEYGRFDAMQDLSYSEHNPNLPQAKFVSGHRKISDEVRTAIAEDLSKKYDVDFNDQRAVFEKFRQWPDQVIWRQVEEARY